MKTVGICGVYGEGPAFTGGQPVKVKIITDELRRIYGQADVSTINTFKWKRNPLKLLYGVVKLSVTCKNIIILPAYNGIKVFSSLFVLLNYIFHRRLHYVVIGGWLPEMVEKNKKLKKRLLKFDWIYVESELMKTSLGSLGLNNVVVMPNFKRLQVLSEEELIYPDKAPYKLCTFSRIIREKGIETAINAVKAVNESIGETAYTLDIYGFVGEEYKSRFDELKKEFPDFISYKGLVPPQESVGVLMDYYALLFPTYYYGEGLAGTLLDAFASGLPVIASDWRYNASIVKNGETGLIFPTENLSELELILVNCYNDPSVLIDMKKHCLENAKRYQPEKAIAILADKIGQ